jgi:hypothetical protein
MKNRLPRKIKKQIPKNTPYCYKYDGTSGTMFDEQFKRNVSWFGTKTCPMSFKNKLGYNDCRYLVKTFGQLNGELGKDNDDLDFCLNDSCKSCGFSEGKYK